MQNFDIDKGGNEQENKEALGDFFCCWHHQKP